MKVVISTHARQRIGERVKCKNKTINKIVKKAWESQGDQLGKKTMNSIMKSGNFNGEEIFKYYQGYIFVFSIEREGATGKDAAVLVTVWNPKYKNINNYAI